MKMHLPAIGIAAIVALLGITAAVAATIVGAPVETHDSAGGGPRPVQAAHPATDDSPPPGMVATDEDSCWDGHWLELRRADGTPFGNQEDCLRYTHHSPGPDDQDNRRNGDADSGARTQPGDDNGGHLVPAEDNRNRR